MLLKRLSPGKHLKEIFCGNETQAVKIAIDVMKKLRRNQSPTLNFDGLKIGSKVLTEPKTRIFQKNM